MKSLKSILEASILADIDDQLKSGDKTIKQLIKKFIKENYNYSGKLIISDEPNNDGKYEVSSKCGITFINKNSEYLTNDMFVWKVIWGYFDCGETGLVSLKGAPQEVRGDFWCNECKSLKSLEGGPEIVGEGFSCRKCISLTSLEGAPKEVKNGFNCSSCDSLTTLKGAPEIVGGHFYCKLCKGNFTENDVKKVSKVKGEIFC